MAAVPMLASDVIRSGLGVSVEQISESWVMRFQKQQVKAPSWTLIQMTERTVEAFHPLDSFDKTVVTRVRSAALTAILYVKGHFAPIPGGTWKDRVGTASWKKGIRFWT